MRILIAGCGYVGIRLGQGLAAAGHDVYGLRRTPTAERSAFKWIAGDLVQPEHITLPPQIDLLVLSAGLKRDAPEKYEALFVHGYSRLIRHVKHQHSLRRIVMVSTTGVFAERDGGWVDESSPTGPNGESGSYYVKAEQLVRTSGIPFFIARLSGIYGPERIRLIREVAEARAVRYPPPIHYLNHLHADDAAGALAHLIQHENPGELYIVSDDDPADRNDVLNWLANKLNMPEPPFAPEDANRPHRRSGNKRCSNQRLRESGYSFRFPTYREGYASLLAANVF